MILENADAFPSCGAHSRKHIQCPSPRKARARSGKQRAELKQQSMREELLFIMGRLRFLFDCDERTDDFHKKCIYYCIQYSRLSH